MESSGFIKGPLLFMLYSNEIAVPEIALPFHIKWLGLLVKALVFLNGALAIVVL